MRRPRLGHVLSTLPVSFGMSSRAVALINAQRDRGTLIVAVANGKGGSGKSTLATNVAIGYGLKKMKVLLIDADIEQRTVSKWPRPPGLFGPIIVKWSTAGILERLAAVIERYDVVLIDFAGRDDRAAAPVFSVVDVLVSPAKPSLQDLDELHRFIDVAKATGTPHVVVFNEATREATSELAAFVKQFAHCKPFLPTAIQQLSAYRRVYARGRSVLEFPQTHPAKQNFERVFSQLDRYFTHIKKSKRS